MKVIIFTDLHITPIKGLSLFEDTAISCLNAIIDYAEKNNIKHIWNLGDTFYKKDYIESYLVPKSLPVFRRLRKFETKFIVGNHDMATDKDNKEHSLLEIFQDYISIVKDPYESVEVDGNNFVFINYKHNSMIKKLKSSPDHNKNVLFGHFDINGFYTNSKYKMEDSELSPEDFEKWDAVFSGHYHKRGSFSNITYIGSTHQMKRLDVNNPFGFVVFDTKTLKVKYLTYENYTPPCFYEYNINDLKRYSKIKNGFLKITINDSQEEKIKDSDLDYIRKVLQKNGNHDVIFERLKSKELETNNDNDVSDIDFALDHKSFFESYLNNIKTNLDKKRLVETILS